MAKIEVTLTEIEIRVAVEMWAKAHGWQIKDNGFEINHYEGDPKDPRESSSTTISILVEPVPPPNPQR